MNDADVSRRYAEIGKKVEAVAKGGASVDVRLTEGDALFLFAHPNLHALGRMAHAMRLAKAPPGVVTYVVDRNINYTNVCVANCAFCAFYAPPKLTKAHDIPGKTWPAPYVLDWPQVKAKVAEATALGATQILMQGGHHPALPFSYYVGVVANMKREFPQVTVHSFSPPEILHLSKTFKMSVRDVLRALVDAGLDSLPGGGAEILSNRVNRDIARGKGSPDDWIGVMRTAHDLGLRTTATMMFGHVEHADDRVEHLRRIRDLEDESPGFTAFIPWTFQPANNVLGIRMKREGRPLSGGFDYLVTLAVSRIFLDNIPNVQASVITQGAKMASIALRFGANDLGGTFIEENVVSAAGAKADYIPEAELRAIISDAGFTPRKRTTQYEIIG
jgi:cyclic dehypoxanthinyl futalosine synthase